MKNDNCVYITPIEKEIVLTVSPIYFCRCSFQVQCHASPGGHSTQHYVAFFIIGLWWRGFLCDFFVFPWLNIMQIDRTLCNFIIFPTVYKTGGLYANCFFQFKRLMGSDFQILWLTWSWRLALYFMKLDCSRYRPLCNWLW